MADTIRLNKVLRELNISIDRVADFLESKGHTIEKRPTTKISKDLYSLLCDEFQIDADKKIASKEVVEAKNKEKEELRIKFEKEQEQKAQSSTITSKSSFHKFKKVGEIDLNPIKEISTKNEDCVISDKKTVENTTEKDSKIQTKYEKLSGLKKTGEKIDLNKFNKPKEGDSDSKNKKKRRRIAKDVINKEHITKKPQFKNKKSSISTSAPSDDEVQKQIKETLEKLQGTSKSKGAKYRKEKRDTHRKRSEDLEQIESEKKVIKVTEFITVGEVATMMDVSGNDIISACMSLGIMVTMNQRLDSETLTVVADEFGYEVDFVTAEIEEQIQEDIDKPEDLLPRQPVVTVNGKTESNNR